MHWTAEDWYLTLSNWSWFVGVIGIGSGLIVLLFDLFIGRHYKEQADSEDDDQIDEQA